MISKYSGMWKATTLAVLAMALPAWAAPRIEHTPVTVAIKGQSLVVRARVKDAQRPVKSVILYYSTGRDAAPFEVGMTPADPGSYFGTIPGSVTSDLKSFTYYLAAENSVGEMAETKWTTVQVREPRPGDAPAGGATAGGKERPKWVTPALIAGGVALAAGGALIAVNASDSGDDGDGGGGGGGLDLDQAAGTYTGEVTLRSEPPGGGVPTLTTRAFSIGVARDGAVSSATIHEGATLTARISGNTFVLAAPISEAEQSGEVRYLGTVVENRIVGTIQGSATSADGVTVYGGIFSAVKP
ncbi:MAG: hypothetical protein KBA51_07610 [Kiritimatiellae bacterium]|nr:hypothetical protein [Kiritimatiellia bacterium]